MRSLALIIAGASALIAGCQSLSVVDKTPNRETVSAILVAALACRETTDPESGELIKCDPAAQPRSVRLTKLDCEALPLRSSRREAAHASCAWIGELVRVNGAREALAATSGEFSLVDLTPGTYRPTREWTIDSGQ